MSQKHVMFNPVTPDVSPPHSGMSQLVSSHQQEDNSNHSKFNLDVTADVSAVTSVDIQEMESVRNHIQNMMKTSKGFDIENEYEETIEGDDKGDAANTSATSVDTAAFLQKLLPNLSPMEEFRAHFADQSRGAHAASMDQSVAKQSNDSMVSSFRNHDKPSSTTNRNLMSENSLLREHLDREKFKRKHCEQQIQELHSKMLEIQQELAVAVSSERKKDVMIEQLDKTLAKVVEGWKKHENEKLIVINTLKQEREMQDQAHQKQQEMLLQFEKELEKAVEAFTKEQDKASEAERQKQEVIEKQVKDREQLLQVLGKEKERAKKSEDEKIGIVEEKDQVQQKYMEAQRQIEELSEKNLKMRSELKLLREEFSDSLSTEKKKIEEERKFYQENKDNAASLQKEVKRLEMELDTTNREKESLKMEMSLMQARHEASKAKEETERQAELEKQMTQRLEELHQHMTKSEAEMRESHRKQIQEISNKHKEEMHQQLGKFHEEIKKKDTKLKTASNEYEERLTEAQDKIASLTNQRQQLENQRQNLTIRMHQMMQAHCDEALRLLSSNRASPPGKLVDKLSDFPSKISPKGMAANWQTSPTSSAFTNPSSQSHTNSYIHQTSYQPTNAPTMNYHTSIPTKHITPSHYNSHNVTKHSISTSHPSQNQGTLLKTSNTSQDDQKDHSRASYIGNQSSFAAPMPVGYPNGYQESNIFGSYHDGDMNEDVSRSGVDFVPLKTIHDDNDTESVISALHGSPDSGPLNGTTFPEEYQSKVMSSGGSNGTLLEQDLEESRLSNTADSPQYRLPIRNQGHEISDKLHEQEQRQAELNHYVNMLLKRSPGHDFQEEIEQFSGGFMKIPSSLGEANTKEATKTSIRGRNPQPDYMIGSNSVTKDISKVQHSQHSAQPQTPPRRDKDPIDLGARDTYQASLTPKQMKQLSKLLSLMSEGQTGVQVPSAEQLFGVMKEMQKGKSSEPRSQDGHHQTGKTNTQPASSSHVKRNLDTSFPLRKQKPVGFPSNVMPEQSNKTDQPKPKAAMVGGPLQRSTTDQGIPRHQAPTKASSKHIQAKNDRRSLPPQTGKQTKPSTAWR